VISLTVKLFDTPEEVSNVDVEILKMLVAQFEKDIVVKEPVPVTMRPSRVDAATEPYVVGLVHELWVEEPKVLVMVLGIIEDVYKSMVEQGKTSFEFVPEISIDVTPRILRVLIRRTRG